MSENFSYFDSLPFCVLDLDTDPDSRTMDDLNYYIANSYVEWYNGSNNYQPNWYVNWSGDYVGSLWPVEFTLQELVNFYWKGSQIYWGGASGTCPDGGESASNAGETLTRGIPRYVRIGDDSCEDILNNGDLMYANMIGNPVEDFKGCGKYGHGYYQIGTWDSTVCAFRDYSYPNGANPGYWQFRAFDQPFAYLNYPYYGGDGTDASLLKNHPQVVKVGNKYYPNISIVGGCDCGSNGYFAGHNFYILRNGTEEASCYSPGDNTTQTVTCDTWDFSASETSVDFEVRDGVAKPVKIYDIHNARSCPSPCTEDYSYESNSLNNLTINPFGLFFY
jgi:hypothetical protein